MLEGIEKRSKGEEGGLFQSKLIDCKLNDILISE